MTEEVDNEASNADLVLSSTEQLRAMANEARLRIVGLLREHQRTMSELASATDARKASISYHLKVLERAGIARQTGTRTVRGGTQLYWELVAPSITMALERPDASARPAVLRVLASQMETGEGARLFVSQVRLSEEGSIAAIKILEDALTRIRAAEDPDGRMVTLASFAYSPAAPRRVDGD